MSNFEKCLAIIAHIGYMFCGVGYLIIPIIIYCFVDMSKLGKHHVKQAIKAQGFVLLISMIFACLTVWFEEEIIMCLLGGFILLWVVFSLVGALKAFMEEDFHYPFL